MMISLLQTCARSRHESSSLLSWQLEPFAHLVDYLRSFVVEVGLLAMCPHAFLVRACAEAWTASGEPLDGPIHPPILDSESAGQLLIAHHALRQQYGEAQQVRYKFLHVPWSVVPRLTNLVQVLLLIIMIVPVLISRVNICISVASTR